MEEEKTPEKCDGENVPLQLIQHNDAKFVACDLRNRNLDKCRSCLAPFCQKPIKVFHHSRNYLACDVKGSRSLSIKSTRSLPANSKRNINTDYDSKSPLSLFGSKGCVECIAPKCKTSSRCSILSKKNNSLLQKFSKTETPKLQTKVVKLSILKENNKYRKLHNASPLKMDPELASYAQEWADNLAEKNLHETRPLPLYGENIMCVHKSLFCVDQIMKLWYQEKYNYNYYRPSFDLYTGHFTQMVWRETEFLGVGVASNDSHIWIVCNYHPPGNVSGHYKENVQPRINLEFDSEEIKRS